MSSPRMDPQGSLSTNTGPVEDDPKNHNQTELKKSSDKEQGMNWERPVQGQELNSRIWEPSFQLRIFYDSVQHAECCDQT